MKEREFNPTGPKIDPERDHVKKFKDILARHKDRAEALLDPDMPSFVTSRDIERGKRMYGAGMSLESIRKEVEGSITGGFLMLLEQLPNTHGVEESFFRRYILQKVRADRLDVGAKDYKYDKGETFTNDNPYYANMRSLANDEHEELDSMHQALRDFVAKKSPKT